MYLARYVCRHTCRVLCVVLRAANVASVRPTSATSLPGLQSRGWVIVLTVPSRVKEWYYDARGGGAEDDSDDDESGVRSIHSMDSFIVHATGDGLGGGVDAPLQRSALPSHSASTRTL